MATTESIQASGGDYTTPQAWYDDHSGDITADGSAPYIGEMKAETFTQDIDLDNSTTDSTHYFHLRAQSGDEFDGDFDGSHPLIKRSSATSPFQIDDNYTRLEHFVIGEFTYTGFSGCNWLRFNSADDCLVDTVGIYKANSTSSQATCIYASCTRLTVRNCAIGAIEVDYLYSGTITARGMFLYGTSNDFYIYNNAIHDISAASVSGTNRAFGIECSSNPDATIVNNVIGTLTASDTTTCIIPGSGTTDIKYNATTDTTGGTNSQDNITPADEFVDTTTATLDLHMKAGGDCEDNGYDLLDNSYANAPEYDCDDEARPDGGTWSIGIDRLPTIESIQASGGDYTTPQAWYDDHSGNITADGLAPYIGELKAETFSTRLEMEDSTTDSTHYFHLRAQSGDEFNGDFDGSYPVISGTPTAQGGIVDVEDDYTRLEHFVVGNHTELTINNLAAFYIHGTTTMLLDGCGVFNLSQTGSGSVYGVRLITNPGLVIRNCSFGDLHGNSSGSFGAAFGIYGSQISALGDVYIYNNAFEGLEGSGATTEYAAAIYLSKSGNVYVVNNVVGTLTASSFDTAITTVSCTSTDVKYNATTDTSGGTNSQDNITPSDEFVDTTLATLDLHMKAGGDCEDNGYDLLDNSYANAPEYDCDDEARPDGTDSWSIGIDHGGTVPPSTGNPWNAYAQQ